MFLMFMFLTLFPDVDECASNPCRNSGTCVDLIDGYNCSCAAGYTGVKCETGKLVIGLSINAAFLLHSGIENKCSLYHFFGLCVIL